MWHPWARREEERVDRPDAASKTDDTESGAVIGLGDLSRFPIGHPVVVDGNGRSLLIVRRRTEIFAMVNRCPHRARELADAAVHGHRITCAGHDISWDLRSGLPLPIPGRRCDSGRLELVTVWRDGDTVMTRLPVTDPAPGVS